MPRFRKNPNFEREFRADAMFGAALAAAAGAVASESRGVAHRIMPRGRGEQITVVHEGTEVFVTNQAYGAHLDEFGSINNPAYAPLRRGVNAAGFHLTES
jgi:hypothetical protein